jgi:hypothetical protein
MPLQSSWSNPKIPQHRQHHPPVRQHGRALLVKPLGFHSTPKSVRRSGLDYHDLAEVAVHEDLAPI